MRNICADITMKSCFREMSIRFAQMERTLGEIDRARAIYAHCSEICDPRVSIFNKLLDSILLFRAILISRSLRLAKYFSLAFDNVAL